jgi:subtilisin family serine protease
MATPHVVGVAALYLGSNPGASPAAVSSALVSNATANAVKSPGKNSPNKLLFTNY